MMFIDEYGDTTDEYIEGNPGNDPVTAINTYPTESTTMQNSNDSSFQGFLNKLGSIGTTATQLGTAVGTAEREIRQADDKFKTARANAVTGNSIGTFWQYATPVEKMMIVLAAVAIVVTLKD